MRTVLVVEDDIHVRALIEVVLTRAGYRTFIARDVTDVIETAALASSDVILLDVNAGGPEFGLDLLDELRARPGTRDSVVVLMTGLGDAEVQLRLQSDRRTACLEKPFSRRELLEAVSAACNVHMPGEAPPVRLYAV